MSLGCCWCYVAHKYTPTNSYTYTHLVVCVGGFVCTYADVGQINVIIKIGLQEIKVFPPSNYLIGFSPNQLILLILFCIQGLKEY